MNFLTGNTRFILRIMLLLILIPTISKAQEPESSERIAKHAITLVIGHTHVPRGVPSVNGGGALIVPSWGLNYDYRISKKWSIGFHADMEIATYIIEEADGSTLERSRPSILSIVAAYRPYKGLALGIGFGNEFEENHNFLVYRFGIEYAFEMGESWEIVPGLTYDVKESTYDSWTLGLGVARIF